MALDGGKSLVSTLDERRSTTYRVPAVFDDYIGYWTQWVRVSPLFLFFCSLTEAVHFSRHQYLAVSVS